MAHYLWYFASFLGADLTSANLGGAKLTHAGFVNADLAGANLIDMKPIRADLTGATWPEAAPVPEGLRLTIFNPGG
jgi:hypothetical protein